jgi:hypothetical protein
MSIDSKDMQSLVKELSVVKAVCFKDMNSPECAVKFCYSNRLLR